MRLGLLFSKKKGPFKKGDSFAITEDVHVKILRVNQLIQEKEKSKRDMDRNDAAELKKLYRN